MTAHDYPLIERGGLQSSHHTQSPTCPSTKSVLESVEVLDRTPKVPRTVAFEGIYPKWS